MVLATLVISTTSHSSHSDSGMVFPQSWFPRWLWPSESNNDNDSVHLVDDSNSDSGTHVSTHVSETVLEDCLRSELKLDMDSRAIRSKVKK